MEQRRITILIVGIVVLMLSSINASAVTESDAQGDVWHFVWPYWQEQTVSNQPNVDIKEIKAEESGDQITLSMTLWPGGTFIPSDNNYVMAIMFYNISDAFYQMSYSYALGQESFSIGMGTSSDGMPLMSDVTVNDNTISTTMNKVGDDTTTVEMYGIIWMYEDQFEDQAESWHDWVGDYIWDPDLGPGDDDDDDTTGDDDDDDTTGDDDDGTTGGTPGFEAIAVFAALTIALIILRRRK